MSPESDSDSNVSVRCIFYVAICGFLNMITLLLCCGVCACKLVHGNDVSPPVTTTTTTNGCQTDFSHDTRIVVIHPNYELELTAT